MIRLGLAQSRFQGRDRGHARQAQLAERAIEFK
jgi:hypothetical protein